MRRGGRPGNRGCAVIRINLLPPEIIERRKYERFYPYVFVATAVMLAVVLVSWGLIQFILASRTEELQRTRESAAELQADAENLAIFELKEQELAVRQDAANKALAGRLDMARLAEEITLVLPEEVWVNLLRIDETNPDTPFVAQMHAPNPLGYKVTDGYKSVASTIIRLSTLDSLSDVWLEQAAVGPFTAFQESTTDNPEAFVLDFRLNSKLQTDVAAPAAGAAVGQ